MLTAGDRVEVYRCREWRKGTLVRIGEFDPVYDVDLDRPDPMGARCIWAWAINVRRMSDGNQ